MTLPATASGPPAAVTHFLSCADLRPDDVAALFARAAELKQARAEGRRQTTLAGKSIALIFEHASTRTRVSFEVGITELGGHAFYLSREATQIGRGEDVRDTARVMSGYVHAMVVRARSHATLVQLADHATIPVVNGLTDKSHPCQALADYFTIAEHFAQAAHDPLTAGVLQNLRLAYIGDGNNMVHSLIAMAGVTGASLTVAAPEPFTPDPAVIAAATARSPHCVRVVSDPREAAHGAQVLYTDVWTSMGAEDETAKRRQVLAPYQINEDLLDCAHESAIVMHCLPAHRGEEITDAVLESPQSIVFTQAGNRLPVQQAILEYVLNARAGGR